MDWSIFFFLLFFTFGFVIYGNSKKRKLKNQEDSDNSQENMLDYLLLGRKLTLPFFIATLVATWYGGIFGVTQIAFESGIYNFITQGGFWYLTYILFAFLLVHRIHQYKAVTLPDLINQLVGEKSAFICGVLNLFNIIPIAYFISIGLLIQSLSSLALLPSMLIGACIVLAYSYKSGFRSVVFSDFVQFFIMCLAVFFVLLFSYLEFGGIGYLQSSLPAKYFSFTGGHTLGETLSWGFIALSTLVDPNFYQRCFAAKSNKVARNGILISTFIWICFDICTTFGAMYARAAMENANSSTAYLIYALQILPDGLRGLFLAGILATILSTLDSYLFLAGTTLSYDILKKRNAEAIKYQKFSLILVTVAGLLLAYLFKGNIKKVWKTLGSLSACSLLVPVLFAQFFPRRIRDQQFYYIVIISAAITALASLLNGMLHLPLELHTVEPLYIGMFTSVSCLVICLVNNKSHSRD